MVKILLDEADYGNGLTETYENAAIKMGYSVTEKTMFDCRHICVAGNIQEAWISFYKDRARYGHPELAETDIMANVMALLLFSGAKVSNELADDEVSIEDGFVTEA